MRFTVFTKPWKDPLPELARKVRGWGFDGVELPVRPGYPVPPEAIATGLPEAVRVFAEHGLRVESVAGPTDERAIAACGAAGVGVIRICLGMRPGERYTDAESRWRREIDAAAPHLARHGVTLGIQNHCGRDLCNAAGLRALLAGTDPKVVAAVWDAAHNALQGEEPEIALDIVWPHLRMVNLKNAVWEKTSPGGEPARWRTRWVAGRDGLASWPRVAAELTHRGWDGVLCLTAEYDDHAAVDRLIAEDLRFARELFPRG